jgi:hypothetical protein
VRAKLAQAASKLAGRGDAGAVIVAYEYFDDEPPKDLLAFDDFTRSAARDLPAILAQRLDGTQAAAIRVGP